MEVKIGIQDAPREIVFESENTAEALMSALREAVAAEGLLVLGDEKGRTIVVPVTKLAYLELGEGSSRRVGFAAS